jgi:hypothetical protein
MGNKKANCFIPYYFHHNNRPEPVFVNILRSPGIDSQHGGPVRHAYLPSYIGLRNRFLGSINVYKYGLWLSSTGGRNSECPILVCLSPVAAIRHYRPRPGFEIGLEHLCMLHLELFFKQILDLSNEKGKGVERLERKIS